MRIANIKKSGNLKMSKKRKKSGRDVFKTRKKKEQKI